MLTTFYVYMLRCRDGSYYVGHTDNLEQRLAQHESGTIPGYTSSRLPVTLVWCDTFSTLRKKEALIRGDYDQLVALSRKATAAVGGEGPSSRHLRP